jgi:hypothetical protein
MVQIKSSRSGLTAAEKVLEARNSNDGCRQGEHEFGLCNFG